MDKSLSFIEDAVGGMVDVLRRTCARLTERWNPPQIAPSLKIGDAVAAMRRARARLTQWFARVFDPAPLNKALGSMRAALAGGMNRQDDETPDESAFEPLRVDGFVQGDIRTSVAMIGPTAVVHGDIYADAAIIHGHVIGDIHARSVELHSRCRVEGSISQDQIRIAPDAFFEGTCSYSCNPLAEAAREPPEAERIYWPVRLAG